MNPLLSVDIVRSFRAGRTIRARFSIPKEMEGRILVVTGESGSGKSTLLRMLAGVVSPDAGSIRWNGEPWFDAMTGTDRPVARRRIGYLPQEDTLFPHMTVKENLLFAMEAGTGILKSVFEGRRRTHAGAVDEALSRFGLFPLSAEIPGNLSGGQRRRVSICRMSLREPSLVLLDEPMNGLDPKAKEEIGGLIRRFLSERRVAGIWVTHDPPEAELLEGVRASFERLDPESPMAGHSLVMTEGDVPGFPESGRSFLPKDPGGILLSRMPGGSMR